MEEDEGGDDEGVAGDLGMLDVFVQERSCVEAEVASAGESEAANDEGDDSKENQEAEDVGEEVVGCSDGVGRGDRDWKITFGSVDEIDEAVEDETVKDEGVKNADGGAFFEGATLKEGRGECVCDTASEIVEARFGVGGAAADAEIEAIEAFETNRKGD